MESSSNDLAIVKEQFMNLKPDYIDCEKEYVYFMDFKAKGLTLLMRYIIDHFVCKKDSYSKIRDLLERDKETINVQNSVGWTALIMAVCYTSTTNGNNNIVKLLLEKGADINLKEVDVIGETPCGSTALMYAHNIEMVKLLLKYDKTGDAINAVDTNGNNLIMGLCHVLHYTSLNDIEKEKAVKIIYYLIDRYSCDLSVQNKEGKNVLMILFRPHDPTIYNNGYSQQCRCNNELAKYMVEKGVDIDQVDFRGNTILRYLCLHSGERHRDFVKYLVGKGCDLNIQDNIGQTILWDIQDKELIELFIKSGCDVNIQDNSGETILMNKLLYGSRKMVEFYLQYSDLYIINKHGLSYGSYNIKKYDGPSYENCIIKSERDEKIQLVLKKRREQMKLYHLCCNYVRLNRNTILKNYLQTHLNRDIMKRLDVLWTFK